MNMSVTEFVVPPAIVGRSRSVWREIIDTVMEGPPRTAADEITEYLARHQYDLSPTLRIELERRHVCLELQRNLLDDARDRPDVEGLSERIAASAQLTRMIE